MRRSDYYCLFLIIVTIYVFAYVCSILNSNHLSRWLHAVMLFIDVLHVLYCVLCIQEYRMPAK